jgi:hypothetical protein
MCPLLILSQTSGILEGRILSPEIGDSLPYFSKSYIVSFMNVHLFVGSVEPDFIPKYVVPACILLGLVYVAYELLLCHRYHKNQRELEKLDMNLLHNMSGVSEDAPVIEKTWTYPSFFKCHAHDSSRLTIDVDVLHKLSACDLGRLTESERWFVEWYYAEKERGITHWSTFGSLSLPDASQDDVCKELRAMLSAPLLEDDEIF